MMKKIISLLFVIMSIVALSTCGSGSPTTPTDIPIAIEGLDGETGVSVNATFAYTFSSAPDSSTVTSDTFFIYPALQTQNEKVGSTISENSEVEYILTPTESLEEDTIYVLSISLSQILSAETGEPLGDDIMIIFSTGDDPIPSFIGTLDLTFTCH